MAGRTIRIGCASGFWGDTDQGAAQLLRSGELDYLVFDYLAEITMALLARARAKDPPKGYVPDFVTNVVAPLASDIAAQGVKLVANAGGMNPRACAEALEQALAEAGVALRVGAVVGDDLLADADSLRADRVREMDSGAPLPEAPWSINAYLGARPIAQALAGGADIVVTGRCVDSAVVLGPLMHEFGWAPDAYDRLAAGSLAGHIVECGTQATGGLFTDWRAVEGWDNMGFPIVECAADGSFTVTKPDGTGGLVTPATVAEQVVYEIGDPRAYALPAGPHRVAVSGAKGRAPSGQHKVCATWHDGYRATGTMMLGGFEAADKARRVADAILTRTRRLFRERNLGDYDEFSVEVLGAEDTYGPHAAVPATREAVLKLAVRHAEKAALELFAREFAPSATSMAQGITGFAGGRPRVTPLIRLFSFMMPAERVPVTVSMDGEETPVPAPSTARGADQRPADPEGETPAPSGETREVPLIALAHGRSGDKGNKANVGILARRPEFVPAIRAAVDEVAVKRWLGHVVAGRVERFEWPGLDGFNFLLHEALGGGGTASLRYDPQGKALAQMLLAMPVAVPAGWVEQDGPLGDWSGWDARERAA